MTMRNKQELIQQVVNLLNAMIEVLAVWAINFLLEYRQEPKLVGSHFREKYFSMKC